MSKKETTNEDAKSIGVAAAKKLFAGKDGDLRKESYESLHAQGHKLAGDGEGSLRYGSEGCAHAKK